VVSALAFPRTFRSSFEASGVREAVVPELAYDEVAGGGPRPRVLADRIESVLRQSGCDAANTVLHVHNHALGKNLSLPGALGALARDGYAMLLQVHDFAEDFRPANYRRLRMALSPDAPDRLPSLLYPLASHVHYAALNGRDLAVLREAGVPARQLHLLPNPVLPPADAEDAATARARVAERIGMGSNVRYVLLPVRGIRRKNLGEALLWAAVAPARTAFGFTLPPLNPLEQPSYARWRALATALQLPCFFDMGGEAGFRLAENLAACDRVLTTSLAEGFGFVFLEPCLAHRPVVGRDLPEITGDFVARGVSFAGLRPRVEVPAEWLGRAALLDMLRRGFNTTLEAYGRPPARDKDLEAGLDAKLRDDCIDFGDLDAALQERVVRRVREDRRAQQTLLASNPFLHDAIATHDREYAAEAAANAAIVKDAYSLQVSGQRLCEIYRGVIDSPRQEPLGSPQEGQRIVDAFLNLLRFRPVRV